MKQNLISYLVQHGKDEKESWGELAERFKIGEGLPNRKRAKKAQDIWRGHLRKHPTAEKPAPVGVVDNSSIYPIKKYKVWDGIDGKRKESIEYAVTLKNEEDNIKQVWADIKKDALVYSPQYARITYKQTSDSVMEICIPDLHLGKLAWDKESGEDYNLEIAKERFRSAILHFKSLAKNVKKFVLIVGNDFFNSDTLNGTTTPSSRNGFKGTPQHDDSRWQKTFMEGRRLIVECIDELREVAYVDVMIIPGNHDHQRSFYLGEVLEAWYHNCHEVVIDNSPKLRKYYAFGKVLLAFTHGDKEKLIDLPLLMAQEEPMLWASAKFKEWHIGHTHKTQTIDHMGVLIRTIPSLAGTDAYHYEHGYTVTKKAAHAYMWNPDKGLICTYQYNLL